MLPIIISMKIQLKSELDCSDGGLCMTDIYIKLAKTVWKLKTLCHAHPLTVAKWVTPTPLQMPLLG